MEIPIDEKKISSLLEVYKNARIEITNELLNFKGKNKITLARKKAILKRIDAVLKETELEAISFTRKELENYYKQGILSVAQDTSTLKFQPNTYVKWYVDGEFLTTTGIKRSEYEYYVDLKNISLEDVTNDKPLIINPKDVHIKRGGKWINLSKASEGFFADKSFSIIHKEAIDALFDESKSFLQQSFSSVLRNNQLILSDVLKEQIRGEFAIGKIKGETRKTIAKRIEEKIKQSNVLSFKDKGNKTWDLETYTNMLVRTLAVRSHNEGLKMQMISYNMDLVEVTAHIGSCPLCVPWQGKILSLSGNSDKYPSLEDAQDDGLFHIGCRHSLVPYTEELANWSTVEDTRGGNQKVIEHLLNQGRIKEAQDALDQLPDDDDYKKTTQQFIDLLK